MRSKSYFGYVLFAILLLVSSHSGAESCEVPEGWLNLEAEENVDTPAISHVAIDLDNGRIPLGEPFAFDLYFCNTSEAAIDRVTANAIMPAHLHGMNYAPTVTEKEGGKRYYVDGFLFHMSGIWKITVSFYLNDAVEHFSVEVDPGNLKFSDAEIAQILTHGPWPPKIIATPDPSNRVSGNPKAIEFGEKLFFSKALSKTGELSCASCHHPDQAFASGEAIKTGLRKPDRNTLSLFNQRLNRWFGWDGRNDNLWAQSLRPIVNPEEMNLTPQTLRDVIGTSDFVESYTKLFGSLDTQDNERVLVNSAKALAAYQETLISGQTPFDKFRDALADKDQQGIDNYPLAAKRGLALFTGRGRCIACHSGPQFSNGEFHDVAVPFFIRPGVVDKGRHQGIIDLKTSPYTLDGKYTDDPEKSGAWAVRRVANQHGNFGIFRVPGLRNVAKTAPYMHNGSLATLQDVVKHYSEIDMERLHADGEAILRPLELDDTEINDLVAFLETLSDE